MAYAQGGTTMAEPAKQGVSEKAASWSGHIEAWQKSVLNQGSYRRQHGLSHNSLSYWRTRLGKTIAKASAPSAPIVQVPRYSPINPKALSSKADSSAVHRVLCRPALTARLAILHKYIKKTSQALL
jgi:hypothetical protein